MNESKLRFTCQTPALQGFWFCLIEALCGEAMDAKALEGQKGLVVWALNGDDIDEY